MAAKKVGGRLNLTLRECTVLRWCCEAGIDRIARQFPAPDSKKVRDEVTAEIQALLLKLTGYPLGYPEE